MTSKVIKVIGVLLLVGLLSGCEKKEKVDVRINEATVTPTELSTVVPTEEATVEPTAEATIQPTANTTNTTSLIQAKNSSSFTIAIDPGHQLQGMSEHEPIAPGATETKPKVSSGTTGVASKIPEYKVTLQVSLLIRDLLKGAGYNIVMVRETHEVSISNSERAKIANNANADAFIRIHCNGATDSSVKGALTMCQTRNNPYCGQYYAQSRSLSEKVINRLCEATGARNKGISETDTMSGINWCSVPVTIVEMGFMSNPEEDMLLVNSDYQKKLAVGIANGVIDYLNTK